MSDRFTLISVIVSDLGLLGRGALLLLLRSLVSLSRGSSGALLGGRGTLLGVGEGLGRGGCDDNDVVLAIVLVVSGAAILGSSSESGAVLGRSGALLLSGGEGLATVLIVIAILGGLGGGALGLTGLAACARGLGLTASGGGELGIDHLDFVLDADDAPALDGAWLGVVSIGLDFEMAWW